MPMKKEFRGKWNTAGYGTQMGSAEVVEPPGRDFIRVYHITSAEFAISDIALQRLKLARLSDVNDPFELLALNFRERRTRKIVRDFKTTYDSNTGLLCFSGNWTNPVLWSHYGGKHRGICLGFDLDRNRAQKVNYQSDRILANLDERDQIVLEKQLRDILPCTKYKHWEYEDEYRVPVALKNAMEEGKLHFYPFNAGLRLKEVILGPLCELSVEDVRQFTKKLNPEAVTFASRLALKFFKVVPKESTVP
jgi:hypothetical protein